MYMLLHNKIRLNSKVLINKVRDNTNLKMNQQKLSVMCIISANNLNNNNFKKLIISINDKYCEKPLLIFFFDTSNTKE